MKSKESTYQAYSQPAITYLLAALLLALAVGMARGAPLAGPAMLADSTSLVIGTDAKN